MKRNIHILFSGLPRFSEKNIKLQFDQLNLKEYKEANIEIYCHSFFWPMDVYDDREKVISHKNNKEIYDFLRKINLFKEVYDYSGKDYSCASEKKLFFLDKLKEIIIKFPSDNALRPDNFKIKIENIVSQYVAKDIVIKNLLACSNITNEDTVIYSRPDICFDKNLANLEVSKTTDNQSIIFPRSGWHYLGYPDVFYIFPLVMAERILGFTNFLVDKIIYGETLEAERIWREHIDNNFSNKKILDVVVFFLRNGRYKSSGADGIINLNQLK